MINNNIYLNVNPANHNDVQSFVSRFTNHVQHLHQVAQEAQERARLYQSELHRLNQGLTRAAAIRDSLIMSSQPTALTIVENTSTTVITNSSQYHRDELPDMDEDGGQIQPDPSEDECVMCYDIIRQDKRSRLPCGHLFHSTYIHRWFDSQRTGDWGSVEIDADGEIIETNSGHGNPVVQYVGTPVIETSCFNHSPFKQTTQIIYVNKRTTTITTIPT